jgi:hypothetical protein
MSDTPNKNAGEEQIPDEVLMEFADGTLPLAERPTVSEALARSPALMERFEAFLFTRGPLARTFDEVLTAPLPEKLLAALREDAPAPVRHTPVRPSDGAFARLAEAFRMAVFSPAGAAAMLLIGAGAGWVLHQTASVDLVSLNERGLTATASLQQALDSTPMNVAAVVSKDLTLEPTLTFRNSDKAWCRQYNLVSQSLQSSGIACREGDKWRVLTQMGAAPARFRSGKTEIATPPPAPPSLLDDIRGQIKDGDVLDRGQEDLLIKEHWQTKP